MSSKFITYEQPLNEPTRLYLRLEHLFKQLRNQLVMSGVHGSRLALEALLKIVDVADRPDLKSKLLQTLRQQSSSLSQLGSIPNIEIDTNKLKNILAHLDQLIDGLHHRCGAKLGDKLRHSPFLKSIRLHLNNPAGPCNFNVPAYSLWLHQSETKRLNDLTQWAHEFDLLENAVTTILKLTRDSTPAQNVTANNVFYQQALDPTLPCQLLRVTVPIDYNLYPEFSVGKHRLSIRFKPLSFEPEPEPKASVENEFAFELSCCRV